MVKTQKSGRLLTGDRPLGRTTAGRVRSDHIMAYTDSDWAENREDKRSMSGGMIVHSGDSKDSGQKDRRRCRFRRVKVMWLLRCQLDWELSDSAEGSETLGTTRLQQLLSTTKRWWSTQHVRDLDWRSTCTRDIFGCKRSRPVGCGEDSKRAKPG